MRFYTVLSCVFIHFCRAFLYITKMRFRHQLMRFHKTAKQTNKQTDGQTDRQTDKHYENNVTWP